MTIQRRVLGILILVIGVPAIGFVVGGLINIISLWHYSTLVCILSNCVSAVLACLLYKITNFRSVIIAVIFGLLVGFAVYNVHLNGDYENFVTQVSVHTNFSKVVDARQAADTIIRLETGSSGPWGYLQYEAKCGIILKQSDYSTGTSYTGWMAWSYIIIDMLIYLSFPTLLLGLVTVKKRRLE